MAIIFKYAFAFVFVLISIVLVYLVLDYIVLEKEPFTTDWDPVGDPNHIKYHQNEIFYLKDWIRILEYKQGETDESAELKDILKSKEVHLQWHFDQYPDKSPPSKQTKFLVF
jgi:hypothetical protein